MRASTLGCRFFDRCVVEIVRDEKVRFVTQSVVLRACGSVKKITGERDGGSRVPQLVRTLIERT